MSVFNLSSLRLTQFTRLCVREFSPAPKFLLRTLSTVREASSLRPQRQEAVEWHDEASNVKPNVLQESLVSSSSPIINGNHSAGSQRLPQRARAQQPRLDQPLCRDTLVGYFNESWSLTESLFSTLKPEAFFEVANPERHPLIFYYGHSAVFFVNKMKDVGLIDEGLDPDMEATMSMGVFQRDEDETMLASDVEVGLEARWPTVEEVQAYRARVFAMVHEIMESKVPYGTKVTEKSPQLWALLMGMEHDRVHLETSLMLVRDLPVGLLKAGTSIKDEKSPSAVTKSQPKNEFVPVPTRTVSLGHPSTDIPHFYWDLESTGTIDYAVEVPAFQAQKYFVSNEEFRDFVEAGGYRRPELWSDAGQEWLRTRTQAMPHFWFEGTDGELGVRLPYAERTLSEVADYPVISNHFEAEAYAKWMSEREGDKYYHITEEQVRALQAGCADASNSGEQHETPQRECLTLSDAHVADAPFHHCSEAPVHSGPASNDGVFGVNGNLWHRTSSVATTLRGFKTNALYADYSEPYLTDGAHYMVMGGCFASSGSYAQPETRNYFRPDFPQLTGIRLVRDAPSSPMPSQIGAFLQDSDSGAQVRRAVEQNEVHLGTNKGREMLQDCWGDQEKGWLRKVERKFVEAIGGLGLFAAEDISKGDTLRMTIPDRNLLLLNGSDCIDKFAKMFADNEGFKSYVADYTFGLETDEDEFVHGIFFPGNGCNHDVENRNIRLKCVYSVDKKELARIDMVAIRDIGKGDEILDNYETFGPAPHFLKTWADGQDIADLTFAGSNDYV